MLASPKRSALLSGCLHAGAIALVLLATSPKTPSISNLRITPIAGDIGRYLTRLPRRSEGGGGGMRDPGPARKGDLPRAAPKQFVPPAVNLINLHPRLPMEPTIIDSPDVVMPVAQIGDPNGVLKSLWAGPGTGGGIGGGDGGGVGDHTGPGAGDGDNGSGITGRTRWQGAATIAPLLLWKVEPEYTEEARRARLQGTVMLRIDVNERGQAQNISVRQSLGLGLDERAIEAVRRWKFRPGSINGKPAVTSAVVEVNFRLL